MDSVFDKERAHRLGEVLREIRYARSQIKRAAVALEFPIKGKLGGTGVIADIYNLGPKTVPELLENRAFSRQYLHRIIGILEDEGFIEFLENPRHKRSKLIGLTQRGRESFEQRHELLFGNFLPLADDLTEDDLEAALKVLRRFRDGFRSMSE